MANRPNGNSKKPLPVNKLNQTSKPGTPPVVATSQIKKRETLNKEVKPINILRSEFVFSKKNYQIMVAGLIVIALGFFLMSGTTDIMSSTKIIIAPIIVLLGFALEFYAILVKPSKTI